jgi:stearoyl-CoA desaturase (delta-9 desaturase)
VGPGRKVLLFSMVEVVPLLGAAACGAYWWQRGMGALDVALLAAMYVLAILGVELSLHRFFSHRGFSAGPWVTRALLVLGALAGQGPAMLWTAMHRAHHAHTDVEGDPHSPVIADGKPRSVLAKFVWAHALWYLDRPEVTSWRARANGDAPFDRLTADWRKDAGVLAWDRAYPLWFLLGFAVPAGIGFAAAGGEGALRGLLAGGFLRHFLVTHAIYGVNSVCHLFGTRPHATREHSRNNAFMAAITLGAGWHNTHHAFPASARLDEHGWQVDMTGWVVGALERLRLISHVRGLPARAATKAGET